MMGMTEELGRILWLWYSNAVWSSKWGGETALKYDLKYLKNREKNLTEYGVKRKSRF